MDLKYAIVRMRQGRREAVRSLLLEALTLSLLGRRPMIVALYMAGHVQLALAAARSISV